MKLDNPTTLLNTAKLLLKRGDPIPTDLYFRLAAHGVDVEEFIEQQTGQTSMLPVLDQTLC